ncbi:MAG: gamma-glutamyltransferase, partial [Bacteroidota bacterium]
MRTTSAMMLAAAVILLGGCSAGPTVLPTSTAYVPVPARAGMVVSSHALASQVGLEVLRSGGNAVDAAVATGLALAVVHPAAGNIGGGGFMIVRWKDGTTVAFDFRERAPAAAHDSMYVDAQGKYVDDVSHEGYLSVGVPGTVAGFDLALQRFGTVGWDDLAAPAVHLAEEGIPLSWAMADDFGDLAKDWRKYPSSARVFLKPDGSLYAAGD